MSSLAHRKTIQEKYIHLYIKETYGEDFLSLDDLLRMEICEDGTVCIGITQIKTGIKL